MPSVSVTQSYSDNIYLEEKNGSEDYITAISPGIILDLAVAPRNYFSLDYRGSFLSYAYTDNFKKYYHMGSLSFNSETAKDSHFVAGVSAEDTAIQPFSKQEQSKDYIMKEAYADILLMTGKVTEIGAEYSRMDREFDELQFADDDYTSDAYDFYWRYSRSPILPLLLQYRYINQDNNDQGLINTDFQSHTVFVGGLWRPGMKLSGALRVGYTWTQFDESDKDDFNGYAIDTDLVYAYSEITKFTIIVKRSIRQTTESAREYGDYIVYTTAAISLIHKRWERITTGLNFFYQKSNFKYIQGSEDVREDNFYRASLSLEYALRRWIILSLQYRYQQNNSNLSSDEYQENRIEFGITLSP